jgi:hypothetical protein
MMMMVAMTIKIKMMVPIVVTLVGIVTDVKSIHLENVYSSNGRGKVSISYNGDGNKYMEY